MDKKPSIFSKNQNLPVANHTLHLKDYSTQPGHAVYLDDSDWIAACQRGERSAQQWLYQKYAGKMFYVCLRYLGNADDARDIMHDAFVKVFASISKFRAEASIETWISRIMANTSISRIRKEAKKNFVKDIDDIHVADEDDQTGVFDLPQNEVTANEVLLLVQNLPTGYRIVLSMYALDGFTHKEIAEKLGISEGTSKSQLAKARKMLKKQLAKYNEPEQ